MLVGQLTVKPPNSRIIIPGSLFPCCNWPRASAIKLAIGKAIMNPASSGFFCDNQLEMTMIDAVKKSFKISRYDILFPYLNIWPGKSKITITSQSQIFCNFTQFN